MLLASSVAAPKLVHVGAGGLATPSSRVDVLVGTPLQQRVVEWEQFSAETSVEMRTISCKTQVTKSHYH